jgi:C-terminal peptidase prc
MRYVIWLTIFLLSVNGWANPSESKCSYKTIKYVWDELKNKALFKVDPKRKYLYGLGGIEVYLEKHGSSLKTYAAKEYEPPYNPERLWKTVKKYHKKFGISLQDACYYSVGGIVYSLMELDDYVAVKLLKYKKKRVRSFVGLDFMTFYNKRKFVSFTDPLSPAYKAGIRAFDEILFINGLNAKKIKYRDVDKYLKGGKGHVEIVVKRKNKTKRIIVKKNHYKPKAAICRYIKKIPYCFIRGFVPGRVYIELLSFMKKIPKKNKKFILDLRGNPGGVVVEAINTASLWTGKRRLVRSISAKKSTYLRGNKKQLLKGYKTVVLVDNGTGSSAEIIVSALRYHKMATIIGTRTYGKAAILRPRKKDGVYFRYTISRLYSLNGISYEGTGIFTDVLSVPTTNGYEKGVDDVIEDAIYILNEKKEHLLESVLPF